MPAREAWGLDIGQSAIHAVKLRRLKGDSCEIADIYFQELNCQLDDQNYDDRVFDALQEFVSQKKVGNTPVVVSLPGFATLFRDFSLPAVNDSRLGEIVSYEAKQLIPYPLDEVIWDFHRLREDEDTGEIGIALVCCRRDIVENMLATLDEAKINVEALQVGPVGLVNYIEYDTPPEGAALVLDTGARGTDFIVINEGSFWLRSIGVSGTDLTKALMSKFSIPFDKAEELKFQVGDSKQGDRVFRVMEPTLRGLCGEVQRSVGYYKSLFRGVNIAEIVCAGNTYLLAGVDQFLADNTGLPTRTLTVPEEIKVNFAVEKELVELNRQVLGTATGLALQGIGVASINTTLLPQDRRFARFMKEKFKWAAAAVGAVALTVILNLLT
ncbi:MAG: type IV pilus assembly protein PilM, partial [Planctomycetes bacterium]|nr:type IV pilus assembly protein PilM [Planctomycetota bacterium]